MGLIINIQLILASGLLSQILCVKTLAYVDLPSVPPPKHIEDREQMEPGFKFASKPDKSATFTKEARVTRFSYDYISFLLSPLSSSTECVNRLSLL